MSGENGPVVASGPPVPPGSGPGVPLRQEIRDLNQNQKLWTLYLLGLKAMEDIDTNAPMSYYQVAGIHGAPHVKWPDRDWNQMVQAEGSQFGGFCTHNSILFLPWHRPYLALYEQAIFGHVQSIAAQLAQELNDNSWVTEAQDFRVPYWDWADPHKGTYPEEALTPTVSIIQVGSKGKALSMDNPLYKFTFASPNQDGNVNSAGETWRIADNENPKSVASTLVQQFKLSFQQEAHTFQEKNLTERVLYMLQGYQHYGAFSNDAFRGAGDPGTYGSLEGIHNTIHNVTGGGGNMSDPDVAAFDPIFWLHHANVDRLFAIWQGLHASDSDPSTYVQSEAAGEGDFSMPPGGTEDANTDLTPFWKDQNSFYNSLDVQGTQNFGYAYPETQTWNFSSTSAYRADLQARLVKLYPAASLANSVREKPLAAAHAVTPSVPLLQARAKSHMQVAALKKATTPQSTAATTRELPKSAAPESQGHGIAHNVGHVVQHIASAAGHAVAHATSAPVTNGHSTHHTAPLLLPHRKVDDLIKDGKYLEWITNVKAKKFEFGGSYNVHIFLGDVPDGDSVMYPLAHSHVGTFSVFARGGGTGCGRCNSQRERDLEVTGQIMLTVALVERYLAGEVESLDPEHIVPFLQRNLHWRTTYANGTAIDRADVNGVLVSVISNEVTLPEQPQLLPLYAPDVQVHPQVTTKADGRTARGDGTGLTDVGQA